MAVGSVAAALIVLVAAGCGGSEASPSPSAVATEEAPAPTEAPVVTEAPPSAEATEEAPATSGTVRLTARCAGVAVRKDPATDGDLVVRLAKGTKVRVVETVTGDPYEAGSCGSSGDDWVKIDRINGKSIKTLYGVSFGYAAGGFFK